MYYQVQENKIYNSSLATHVKASTTVPYSHKHQDRNEQSNLDTYINS